MSCLARRLLLFSSGVCYLSSNPFTSWTNATHRLSDISYHVHTAALASFFVSHNIRRAAGTFSLVTLRTYISFYAAQLIGRGFYFYHLRYTKIGEFLCIYRVKDDWRYCEGHIYQEDFVCV